MIIFTTDGLIGDFLANQTLQRPIQTTAGRPLVPSGELRNWRGWGSRLGVLDRMVGTQPLFQNLRGRSQQPIPPMPGGQHLPRGQSQTFLLQHSGKNHPWRVNSAGVNNLYGDCLECLLCSKITRNYSRFMRTAHKVECKRKSVHMLLSNCLNMLICKLCLFELAKSDGTQIRDSWLRMSPQ